MFNYQRVDTLQEIEFLAGERRYSYGNWKNSCTTLDG